MDKFDRHRVGDRFNKSSESPHNHNASGRHSLGGGHPFHTRYQDNYRGGGGRESPHGFSGGGGRGRGGARENHMSFESPPPYSSPSGGGGIGGGGLKPIVDGIGGFRPLGGREGFVPMGDGGGRGFRPMGGGGDLGGFRPMGGFVGEGGKFPPIDGDNGRLRPVSGAGGDGRGFPPMGGGSRDGGGFGRLGGSDGDAGGFQAMDGGGSDSGMFGFDNYTRPPLAGQKRGYSSRERSPGREGDSFAKLFVGSVPRHSTEDDIRPPFENHGRVIEVALIKDKKTGLPQGCCFIKYASPEEADRAIGALHNQYTLPGVRLNTSYLLGH